MIPMDPEPDEWPATAAGGEPASGPAGPEWTSEDDRSVGLDDGDDSDAGPYDDSGEHVEPPDDPSLWEEAEG
jgi:hypothetical protein